MDDWAASGPCDDETAPDGCPERSVTVARGARVSFQIETRDEDGTLVHVDPPARVDVEAVRGASVRRPRVLTAHCALLGFEGAGAGIEGDVTFESDEGSSAVRVTVRASGVPDGAHAIHVHKNGDLRALVDGASTGPHFAGAFWWHAWVSAGCKPARR